MFKRWKILDFCAFLIYNVRIYGKTTASLRGVLQSTANLSIIMIAGGNHTLIYRRRRGNLLLKMGIATAANAAS